jgi:hypothetical protein
MKRIISIAALAGLALGACSNDQGDVADAFIDQAKDQGIEEIDEACVRDLATGLSDDDVKSLEEGSDRETSPEGTAILGLMLLRCASTADVIAQIGGALPAGVDQECVVESMKTMSTDDLLTATEGPLGAAALACVTSG